MTASVATSRKAVASLILGILCFLSVVLMLAWDAPVLFFPALAFWIASMVLACVARTNIERSGGSLKGNSTVWAGIGLSLLSVPLVLLQAAT